MTYAPRGTRLIWAHLVKTAGIVIDQTPEGLADEEPVHIPLDPNVTIRPNSEGNEGDRSNTYAQLLGELQFVANSTRPDIAYTANPKMQHWTALKRILRYLSGT